MVSKLSAADKKRLKELQAELKTLQAGLALTKKREGKDPYITVTVVKNQGRLQKLADQEVKEMLVGKFFIELSVTAKQQAVFVPLSVASGKKTAGFMYYIEGTAPGLISRADVQVRGDEVSQVTLGTLLFAKIPAGTTASFTIQATIRGTQSKRYKLVFSRLNYKLHLTDTRYVQYLKEIHSPSVLLS